MVQDKLTRFKDASWLGQEEPVIIGGAGGISSWLTLMLARANFAPIVYDFDILETHNLGGQLFPSSGIGKPKVEVLSEIVRSFAGVDIWVMNEKYVSNSMTGKYVFSGFDNMEARRIMFHKWTAQVSKSPDEEQSEYIFIDGRLLAEQMQIFCIRGNDVGNIDRYRREFLFSDEEVADGPCTMKQTSHAAAMIASFMTGYFTNHIHNVRTKSSQRHVPFYHEYFIPLDLFT